VDGPSQLAASFPSLEAFLFHLKRRSSSSNSRFITFLLCRAAIFYFSAASFSVASFLISSPNSSSSHRFSAFARKLVSVLVCQLSLFNSIWMTSSVPYVR